MTAVFLLVSTVDGLLAFGGAVPWRTSLQKARSYYRPWRLVNTYHLFGHITRQRIEPEFQEWDATKREWRPLFLHYKPGEPGKSPLFAAPHQPRLDFQLWFYGLGYRRGMPEYVSTLASRLCHDPRAVQPLFRTPLSPQPEAVRITFWQYHFTTPAEAGPAGDWWRRERIAESPRFDCRNLRR